MKGRRHTNNKGLQQIKRGKTYSQVKRMARRLRLPFHASAPVLSSSLPSGESDLSVMMDCAGADTPPPHDRGGT